MRITESKLRQIIRKVLAEHGGSSHQHEPHGGYVEGMALGFVDERMDFEEYIEFAKDYGYTDEQELAEWWDAAIDQLRAPSFRAGFGDGYAPKDRSPKHSKSYDQRGDVPFGLFADKY